MSPLLRKLGRARSAIARAFALSEGGSTIGMGQTLLLAYATESSAAGEKLGFKGVVEMLQAEDGKKFLAAAAVFDKCDDAPKTPAALQTAAKDWVKFFNTDTKSKAKRLQRMVKTAATSYLFGMELLQWLAAMEHRDEWAAKMKSVKGLQPDKLREWLRSPSDDRRLTEALLAAYNAQVDFRRDTKTRRLSDSDKSEAAAGSGQNSIHSSASDCSSSSKSSSSSDKKNKKKSKKKHDKKDKKKAPKKKKADKDKSRKSKKSKSPEGPACPRVMKIRRVTGLTADGRVSVKDTDLYDEIELGDKEATVADLLEKFFEIQSSKEEFQNWEVKALLDGKCVSISAESTPSALCTEVVLIRKGG